jgi:hypothetical protein
MSIILNGTTGITTPDITSTTSTLGSLTQALDLGSTGQIVFPATQNASANANTLDDYEEGVFTPVFLGSTASGTFTYNTSSTYGRYVKIGQMVKFDLGVVVTNGSGATGDLKVGGLPFAVADFSSYFPAATVGYFIFTNTGWTQYDQSTLLIGNSTNMYLYFTAASGSLPTSVTAVLGGSASVYISGTYLTTN